MLTFSKIAGGAPSAAKGMTDYLLEQTIPKAVADLSRYYTRGMDTGPDGAEPRQDMHPLVARGLGIDPTRPVLRDEINGLLAGRRADGQAIGGKHYSVERAFTDPKTGEEKRKTPIGAVDFTLTPDKSVSLAWAFATPAEQAAIYQAHRDAAHDAMRYVETHLARVGKGAQGKDGHDPGHIGWIAFDHFTSRPTLFVASEKGGDVITEALTVQVAGDPNLHTHFTVPNAIFTGDGRVGSFDLDRAGGFIKEGGAVYQAFLAANLRKLGADVVLDPDTGMARLPAIPDPVRTHFSKKTTNGEDAARAYARQHDLDWDTLSPERRSALLKRGAQNLPLGLEDEAKRKLKKDDTPAFSEWRRQAADIGWNHETVVAQGPPMPPVTRGMRVEMAYDEALPWLQKELDKRAVISGPDVRAAAARGLIAAGITEARDVDRVTAAFREWGVRQHDETTALVWGHEAGRKWVSITTGLHEQHEKDFIAKARAAAADRSDALPRDRLERAVAASGLDFDSDHGRAQLAAIHRLGEGGRLGVVIGAAGAGKTTMLQPLVSAWKESGRRIYGAALAWRQADDLVDAGISKTDVKALSVFLDAAGKGEIALDAKSVVIVDELSLLGTRQGLELLRLQEQHGFRLQMIGDDRQCQSIEAGPIIDLARKALGEAQVPEIHTTVRQQTERERTIAGLFRDGDAAKALEMKRQDGTVELVAGGYRETVERVAELVAQRIQANATDPEYSITVSAPTNMNAHHLGVAIREKRRESGQVGPDAVTIKATDRDGRNVYDMALAAGDRVRLFASTKAEGQRGSIGRNGSILTVTKASDRGIAVRNAKGTEGFIPWGFLCDRTGNIRLAYGEVMTTHTAQGSTSTEHIYALPAGSQAVTGFSAYSSGTRHRRSSYMLLSAGAERAGVMRNRPLNETRPISDKDVWANVARNLGRQPTKAAALDFLDRAHGITRGAARAIQRGLQPFDLRKRWQRPPTTLRQRLRYRMDVDRALKVAISIEKTTIARAEFFRRSGPIRTSLPRDAAAVLREMRAEGYKPAQPSPAVLRELERFKEANRREQTAKHAPVSPEIAAELAKLRASNEQADVRTAGRRDNQPRRSQGPRIGH